MLYALLDGPHSPLPEAGHHLLRVALLSVAAAAVAVGVPRSETLFALTGAVGVSIVCYFFPVVIHMRLVRYRSLNHGRGAPPPARPASRRAVPLRAPGRTVPRPLSARLGAASTLCGRVGAAGCGGRGGLLHLGAGAAQHAADPSPLRRRPLVARGGC